MVIAKKGVVIVFCIYFYFFNHFLLRFGLFDPKEG